MDVGSRIRMLRGGKGLSLRKAATISGMSPSLLSQIETGKVNPSLSTLRKIAQAIDVPVFYLVLDGSYQTSGVIKKAQRRLVVFPKGGLQYEIIHSNLQKQMGIHIGTLKPGGMTSEEPLSHQGEECIIILDGKMHVEIRETTTILEAEDSFYFDSSIPHRLYNKGDRDCLFYLIITPPKF
jgi:transcriptional regulator with XRE-family HTH domain